MSVGGLKDDNGKLRYDLIPWEILHVLAWIFTVGAAKYGERNCEKGFSYGRLIGAAFRHMIAFIRGQATDEETGLPHLAQAAWNLLMLYVQTVRGTGVDDRVKL